MVLTLQAADEAVAKTEFPKVTRQDIEAEVTFVQYSVHGVMTICIATMRNGYTLVGTAAAVSPENFNPEVGQRYALEDCYRQAWPLMGYALRERLNPSPTYLTISTT